MDQEETESNRGIQAIFHHQPKYQTGLLDPVCDITFIQGTHAETQCSSQNPGFLALLT